MTFLDQSGIVLGANVTGVQVSNSRVTCPKCHGLAEYLDGQYASPDSGPLADLQAGPPSTWRLYSALRQAIVEDQLTRDEAARLARAVQAARAAETPPDEIVRTVENLAPSLGATLRENWQRDPVTFVAGIAAILTFILEVLHTMGMVGPN